ncbi:hypothetical protein PybrP1_006458 [[Pythium] brassicae (nom. inval.)]|nr:hypothetical protein PybrP1_006458 [[Pythium] brassicae (nom. inval.)]
MKKNGVDIRLCIDYRLVNQLIKLMNYPLPLIGELLDNFEAVVWFLSLDMASGFWAMSMTERTKLISAYIYPLGHFQWKDVDPEVPEFFSVDPARRGLKQSAERQERVQVTAQLGSPGSAMDPVLRRSSYINNIAYGARDWGSLCVTLENLLYRLGCWGISVILPKSSFGNRAISYLSHESFQGSLNYHNKFIEGFPVLASELYELTDVWIKSCENLDRAKLLGKEHDGVIFPVRFTGRKLHDADSRYQPTEREILALLRVLSTFHTMIVGQQLEVLSA